MKFLNGGLLMEPNDHKRKKVVYDNKEIMFRNAKLG